MKTFKMILCCVIPTLLVLSIILNILLLCGFEFSKPKQTDKIYSQPAPIVVTDEDMTASEKFGQDNATAQNETSTVVNEPSAELDPYVLYEDKNIKVTYLSVDTTKPEPTYIFQIENLSSKTLNILCTDVYIDGQQVFVSGLTCENLLPGTLTEEEFVVSAKDFEHGVSYPESISFRIKLINSKSYLDLYESDRIKIDF